MTVRVIEEPSVEPITVAEAKLFMRETQDEQDAVIGALITAVRQYGENYTRRAFVRRKLELTLPEFPCGEGIIEVPKPPLRWVESIKYIDVNGVLQTVDPAAYQVDTYSEPGRIKPAYNEFWQVTRNDFNPVQVRYVCGYPEGEASPSDQESLTENIPAAIKQWMKARVATLYENREMVAVGTIVAELPKHIIDGMLDPYIVRMFR